MRHRRPDGSLQDWRWIWTPAARFDVGKLESERGDSKPDQAASESLDRRVPHSRAGAVGKDEEAAGRFGLEQQGAEPPVVTDGDGGLYRFGRHDGGSAG
jgi:hypothetical protein